MFRGVLKKLLNFIRANLLVIVPVLVFALFCGLVMYRVWAENTKRVVVIPSVLVPTLDANATPLPTILTTASPTTKSTPASLSLATPTAKPTSVATKSSSTPTPSQSTPTPQSSSSSSSNASVGGCSVFPADNSWNTDISNYPVHSNSANYIATIGSAGHLHADFGGGGDYGIPFVVVPENQSKVPITFTAYGDESDPGPYPIPSNAPVEGGSSSDGDRHVLVLQQGACKVYEMFRAFQVGQGWNADAGAVFDLKSNNLRPDYWTSTDAAGLSVFAGLVRYDEVANGAVNHALRFTVQQSQKAFIHPATHYASSSTDANRPPMGLRLRLKSSYDTSHFTGQSKIILDGLKKYGMIVADNGSNWFITGAADSRWSDEDLNQLKTVPGSVFEAVDTGSLIK